MSISAGKLRQHTDTTTTRGQLGYGPGSSHAGLVLSDVRFEAFLPF